MAQPQQLSPLDSAIQAFHKARSEGRFEEAAAKREEARTLLAQTPVESERFAGQVQGVSQLYQSGGMNARAREIAESAVSRTVRLPDSYPTRVMLLNMLANQWQEDRNLLKALPYLQKAAAALESAPASEQTTAAAVPASRSAGFGGTVVFMNSPSRSLARGGPGSPL